MKSNEYELAMKYPVEASVHANMSIVHQTPSVERQHPTSLVIVILLRLLQLDRNSPPAGGDVVLPAEDQVLGHQLSRAAQALDVADALNSVLEVLAEPLLRANLAERKVHRHA